MARPRFAWTARADGDVPLGGPTAALPEAPRPWSWLRQVHGPTALVVDEPGAHAGAEGDALVTAAPGCALAVRTADCAPVVLVAATAVGVVHAGWRGLEAGVVAHAVTALRQLDGGAVAAHIGPCIRAGCYEFTGPERLALAHRFGPEVAATTMWGTPALDLPAAVRAALAEAGVGSVVDDAPCTACDRRWFSHRARAEPERFATVAWMEP